MALHSKADYTYQVDGKIVTIRDLNLGNISVTNDAEEVLERIGKEVDLSDKKVQYYDSCGQLDRLLHENGVFAGFAPGPWPKPEHDELADRYGPAMRAGAED